MKFILKLLFVLAFGAISALAMGFVLQCQVAWFVNPVFTEFPRLNYVQCVSFMYMLTFIVGKFEIAAVKYPTPSEQLASQKEAVHAATLELIGTPLPQLGWFGKSLLKNLTITFLYCPMSLLIGYILHRITNG